MSSGTFGYPLCFSAMLVVIGLMVLPRTEEAKRASAKGIVPVEIAELRGTKRAAEMIERCDEFLRSYPDAENAETVANIVHEHFAHQGDWKEVVRRNREFEKRFPKSESLDRYVFFQGIAFFQDASLNDAIREFDRFLKSFPNSPLVESAYYYRSMSYFLSNNHEETLAACKEFLERFPNGHNAGDVQYRLSFIDYNDKKVDQADKIIRELSSFLAEHPDDAVNGSMLCLLGDTYKKKKGETDEEAKANEDKAIESYIKAVWTNSPDDVILYALDSATDMLKARKDWARLAAFNREFRIRKPNIGIAIPRFEQLGVVKLLEAHIADPSNETVEFMIDELVKSLVPRRKAKDVNIDDLDKQLAGILDKAIADQENATTEARVLYARARLARMLKRNDRADFFLKDIALKHAKDPSVLSPTLLETAGNMLLKLGELDGAEAMYKRLGDRFPDAAIGDAGPVGLGFVALARNKPEEALKIFDKALVNNPGISRFKEASLGKFQSLVDLDRLDPAEKLAQEIVGERKFRGESAAKAYLLLARIYRKQAAKEEGEKARDWLKKAHGVYIRVFVAYKSLPDLSAEGIWEAAETAREIGDEELRRKHLKDLIGEPKLENTEFRRKALEEIKPGD